MNLSRPKQSFGWAHVKYGVDPGLMELESEMKRKIEFSSAESGLKMVKNRNVTFEKLTAPLESTTVYLHLNGHIL